MCMEKIQVLQVQSSLYFVVTDRTHTAPELSDRMYMYSTFGPCTYVIELTFQSRYFCHVIDLSM